jgi:Protein of unknown function (DUF1376)
LIDAADSLPGPLVSSEVDLRDFGFMPLDVLRLRDSDLATLATGDEFKAAVLLWCVAWHQIPAGSLPNDERWLARHSGAGPGWKKVRQEALRGFVLCSDGRLYHGVVCAKARESWGKKQDQRAKTLKARIAGINKRLTEAVTDEEKAHLSGLLQTLSQSLSHAYSESVTSSVTDSVTASKGTIRDSKGTGTVKGNGSKPDAAGAARAKPPDPIKDEIWKTGKAILIGQGDSRESAGSFLGKLCKDFGQNLVVDAVRDCAKTAPAEAKAWLVARCQERRATSGNKQLQLEERNRQAAEQALREHSGHG